MSRRLPIAPNGLSYQELNRKSMQTLIKPGFFAVIVTILVGCGHDHVQQQSRSTNLQKRIDSLVQLHLDSNRIAGLTIGVAKGDSVLMQKSYGCADLDFKVPLPMNGIFQLGSMSKQFTAVAILQLAEQGKLNLDEDIRKHVTFNTHGRTVSIRQLLTHTSGIRDYAMLPDFESLARLAFRSDSILHLVENEDFDFDPQAGLLYSNSGYHLLGLILEKISGMSYEDYLRVNFFEKFSMKNSFICSEQTVVENQVHGYRYNKKLIHSPYLDHKWTYGTGSVCSTVEDFIKWNTALHNGQVLSTEMYDELISSAVLADGTLTRYAKGLAVWESMGRKVISHGGRLFGFSSEGRYFPDEKLLFVTFINTLGPVSPEEINDLAASSMMGPATQQETRFDGDVSKFCGTFEGYGKGARTKVKVSLTDSVLTAQFGSGRIRKLQYSNGNKWTHERDLYEFLFDKDSLTGLRVDRVYDYYVLARQ